MQNPLTDDKIRDKIAVRAYELYLDRGGQHGRDIDDWLKAETEVLAAGEQPQKKVTARKQPSMSHSGKAAESTPKTREKALAAG